MKQMAIKSWSYLLAKKLMASKPTLNWKLRHQSLRWRVIAEPL